MDNRQKHIPEANQARPASPKARRERTRVLTVLPDFPFPTTTGLHLRMVSNLELVHRLGCFSSLLYFSTEERNPPPLASTPLLHICDEVRHGGRRFPHSQFSTASLIAHKLDFLVRGALGLSGNCYPFSMSYDRIGAEQTILAAAQDLHADFAILPSMFMAMRSSRVAAPCRRFALRVGAPQHARFWRDGVTGGANLGHKAKCSARNISS